jgi:hypothetical protein
MKEPFPVRRDSGSAGGKEPTPRKDTHEARRPGTTAPDETCPVVIHYYMRMRPRCVYPLTVEVTRSGRQPGRSAAGLPALVRPSIPGALVVPAEQKLDASIPGSQVVFHVTPLARQRLHGARIDVQPQGRPVQEIPLRTKVTSQVLTMLLLALTVLAPWGLVEMARNPLRGDVYDLLPRREESGTRAANIPTLRRGDPDEVLRDRFRAWVRTNLSALPRATAWIASDAYGQNFHKDRQRIDGDEEGSRVVVYNDLAAWISWVYAWTLALCADGLVFYAGLVLLGLALASWVLHRAARTNKRQALVFAAPLADAGAETLPLDGSEESRTID